MNFTTFIRNTIKVEPNELLPVMGSFLFAFLLMASYSMLKPVRDAMASDWSDATVSMLWTGTFLFSFMAVAAYGWVASRVSMKWLVPGTYAFFASTFIVFYLAYLGVAEGLQAWLGQAYYVWVSVFALFHISVFWSFMTQLYTRDQVTCRCLLIVFVFPKFRDSASLFLKKLAYLICTFRSNMAPNSNPLSTIEFSLRYAQNPVRSMKTNT